MERGRERPRPGREGWEGRDDPGPREQAPWPAAPVAQPGEWGAELHTGPPPRRRAQRAVPRWLLVLPVGVAVLVPLVLAVVLTLRSWEAERVDFYRGVVSMRSEQPARALEQLRRYLQVASPVDRALPQAKEWIRELERQLAAGR